jgi:hypothetical protein
VNIAAAVGPARRLSFGRGMRALCLLAVPVAVPIPRAVVVAVVVVVAMTVVVLVVVA